MKIECLKPCGYCSGVKRAIQIAIKAKKDNPNKTVYVFGMLVHNKEVMSELNKIGINILEDLNYISNNDILVIPAHGMSKNNVEICKQKNITIYDATCPKVESNINIIKNSDKEIIYIGYKNHAETRAAVSYSNNINIYDINEGIDYSLTKSDCPLIINQTTISINDLKDIHLDIRRHFKNAQFLDEICSSTRIRQENIIKASNDVDCFIVVGDSKSSNTNRLFELAKASHPNSLTLIVENYLDLDKNILKNKKHILIAGGASTSPETIDGVLNFIKDIK